MSSAVARVTPVVNAETVAKCHLLSLPAELREMIWSFVLVEPEPIISYVERRTIRGRDYRYPRDSNTIRIKQAVPCIPPLACVARHLHEEVMAVFYGANTFAFNLNKHNPFEVDSWIDALRMQSVDLMDTDNDCRGWWLIDHNVTIRLDYSEREYVFKVKVSGALTEECLCRLNDQLETRDSNGNGEWDALGPMSAATKLFEFWVTLFWLPRDTASESEICRSCEKPRYLGIDEDVIDQAFDRRASHASVRSLFYYSSAIEATSSRTQRQIMPQLPALALVAKFISNEVLAVYYKKHTFAFTIVKRNTSEVSEWLDVVRKRCEILCSDFDLESYLTIRIHFALPASRPAVGLWAAASEDATIEYQFSKGEGGWVVRLGGALQSECECWVAEVIENDEGEGIVPMADLTWRIEQRMGNFWLHRKRGDAFVECQKCGKQRYDRENVESSDDESGDEI
ncbi:hypothetical protein LTR49_024442 [Elasticomyces elasticus]|nr:hypothetical protein LTR49_024442 [Elasticomyces elasticus]